MGTYSSQEDDFFKKKLLLMAPLVGSNVSSVVRIGGGRNGRVYLVICENSEKYVGKFYFFHELDSRDRMDVEFSSLQFLWYNGIRSIPKPIAVQKEHRFAIYDYVEGKELAPQGITSTDIEYAAAFIKELNAVKERASDLPLASEACFSVQEIVENLESRYGRLASLSGETGLNKFLESEFLPLFNKVVSWCKSSLADAGLGYSSRLDAKDRTLSPSDFGFHNALRRNDGSLAFLDFEHFGWDDPAKMISDFLLHPEMNLSEELKKRFVRNIISYFSGEEVLKERLKVVFPLFGLKWCLIFLNEFLFEHFLRRQFAYKGKLIAEEIQVQQLEKAKNILSQIGDTYGNFPYKV